MQGKKSFAVQEANQIRELLRRKSAADPSSQKTIRAKLRQIGFYISDFGTVDTPADFDRLVDSGAISIDGAESVCDGKPGSTVNVPSAARTRASDEVYVIGLCDEVLGICALRQHRFDFLRGDPGISGRCVRLPVDAYYPTLSLVVEYRERQHTELVPFFDGKPTVSGVGRGDQRRLYDELRRRILPEHRIALVELSYADFPHTSNKRLLRNPTVDSGIVRSKLGRWLGGDNG